MIYKILAGKVPEEEYGLNQNKIFARCVNFFRLFPVKKNRITLIEKLDTGGSGSLFELERECRKRDLPFKFYLIRQADYRFSLFNLGGLIWLFTRKAYLLATSSWVFLNDNFMPMAYMNFSEKTKVVQFWHGMGSFKKFGGSLELEPWLREELYEANCRVDYILASSRQIMENYQEAFIVPEWKVVCVGCPQADYYFRMLKEERRRLAITGGTVPVMSSHRKRLEERYPALRGKKLALYAPTFRDDPRMDQELLSHFDFEEFEKRLGDEYCLVVRLHPQIQSSTIPEGVVDLTDYPNIRRLLCMTDLLIADYSSVAVEYSLLGRPIILYAFDEDWYLEKDRDFYFDYRETAPGPVVHSMEELIGTIEQRGWDLKKVEAFSRLHNEYFDDKNTERVADFLFSSDED